MAVLNLQGKMMLIIHVKHYLNSEGKKIFDAWFKQCFDYLSKQDGFCSLQRAFDDTEPETVHIWLHFENREKMAVWGNSPEHAELISAFDPYRTRDWEATWYDTAVPCVEKFVIPRGMHSVL